MAANELTMQAIDARVRKLEDIEEIRNLRRLYHYFVNEGLGARMPEVYTEDAIVDMGPLVKVAGHAAITEFYAGIPRRLDMVVQYIHNHIVDVKGDDATGTSYFDARYSQNGESVIVSARLDEKYVRTLAGWRISETLVEIIFGVPVDKGWAGEPRNNLRRV